MNSWKTLEEYVRDLSSLRWGAEAREEYFAGVKLDCVVKIREDFYVIVEITENDTLSKVRDDIIKLQTVRNAYRNDDIYAKCYCVVDGNVTLSMIDSGKSCKIDVLTLDHFENEFFNFKQYSTIRSEKAFGSCVDAITGKNEISKYVHVKYKLKKSKTNKDDIGIENIIDMLWDKKNIVLLGEFGCGKSRCVKELFTVLSQRAYDTKRYPLAVNLRDNWGLKTSGEIIRRHFEELGLSKESDSVIRSLHKSNFCILLDGFDEISTQLWSDEPGKLEITRYESLSGVRDLIESTDGGVLISGREHYFNSDKEMLHALGLDDSVVIVVVNNEFTEEEYEEFISIHSSEIEFPLWLPKRPLICSLLLSLEPEFVDELFQDIENDTRFWSVFINVVCKRESRIKGVLEPDTIKKVLIRLSRLTRSKSSNIGPISLTEIKRCFEDILGQYPIDQASVMLQRLPGLGRYETETENRRFIDVFILDGLRALDLIDIVTTNNYKPIDEIWINPLYPLGLKIVAQEISDTPGITQKIISYLKKSSTRNNKILPCDLLSSLLLLDSFDYDFDKVDLLDGVFTLVNLSGKSISNISIASSSMDRLIVDNFKGTNFKISDCIIGNIEGITGQHGLPFWISKCDVEAYSSLKTTAAIKRSDLSIPQKIFVTIIKKTFFQKGKGRKEEALTRGLGFIDNGGYTDKIIKLLLREEILNKSLGDEGTVYIPVRKYTDRMKHIISELTLSNDSLWKSVSSL